MPQTKTLKGYLVVDWKEETHRTRKNKPSKTELSPYELVLPLEVEVHVPDVDTPEISHRLEVPQVQVEQILREQDYDESDLEEWQETAEEILTHTDLEMMSLPEDIPRLVGETMLAATGVPDPSQVEAYIRDRVQYHQDKAARREE